MSDYLAQSKKQGKGYDEITALNIYPYQELANKILNAPKKVLHKTGFFGLDDLIGGFEAGRLYVLSAPTKQGKTTLSQTIMYNMALQGDASLIFEYEMGWEETIGKFMEMDGVSEGKKPSELCMHLPMDLHRGGGQLQYLWIYEAIEKAISENKIKLVVIDHLHFLLPLKETQNTSFVIGGIVREIKRIAVALKIPIILIAHVGMIKDEKVPDWTDIRDSSFITQEADVTLMMYRAKNKNANKKVTDDSVQDIYRKKALLSVELNRGGGKTGRIALWHDGKKFIPYTDSHKSEEEMNGFIELANKYVSKNPPL